MEGNPEEGKARALASMKRKFDAISFFLVKNLND